VSQQAFYETVQREQERMEYEQELLAERARLASLQDKWPSLKSWPGREKKSPVLSSGNGNGFEPQSNHN
jgi:hypothetical protein